MNREEFEEDVERKHRELEKLIELETYNDTANTALIIAEYAFNNLFSIDAIPGLEGEIQLAIFYDNDKSKYLEITIGKDQRIEITKYCKTDTGYDIENEHLDVNIKDVFKRIIDFKNKIA